MADSDSDNSWVLAEVESDGQEKIDDDDFCILGVERNTKLNADVEYTAVSDAEDSLFFQPLQSNSDTELEANADAYSEDSLQEVEVPSPISWKYRTKRGLEYYSEFPKQIKLNKKVNIEDVVREHALHFLPAKSLCRFKTVSRGWDQWISTPLFAHRQTTCFKNVSGLFYQAPGCKPSFISFHDDAYGMPDPSLDFLPERVNIRSSCNGLVCCQSVGDNVYYICNPVTQQWKKLPRPAMYHGDEAAIVLVFEPRPLNFNESYELVCAITVPDTQTVQFEIYSSRSSSWRLSETICCEQYCLGLDSIGFYMKDVVYWKTSSGVILAFHLRSEEYGVLPLPLNAGEYGALTMMNGELCYILPQEEDDVCNIYIYGNLDMSLKTVIKLTSDDVGSILGVCRAFPSVNDDILILALGRKVIAYHVREQKAELICTSEVSPWISCHPYVNNLVEVKDPLIGQFA
ncbi:hypothetical protein COLO4_22097 [Corchorus olitorius]|uniref:F-box protein At3g26010-like beta-propeller domain-containing protein n=1 Tax=Corchorus olitorius TaxID=93759 RepID=A0A1R3IP31_9ROSI|nr:hypothetical protein COLO4_22097 [Corchorus olitorius]